MKAHENISCKLNNSSKKKGSETMESLNVNFTKTFKNFFIVAFSMVVFALLSYGYVAHAEKGECGDNLTYTISDEGELTISGTGDTIKEAAFIYSGIKSVTIPSSVTIIENSAFFGCTSLTEVNISEGLKSIGELAFGCCLELTSVTIPKGVTSIGNEAFRGCSSLKSVTISSSEISVGNDVFYECNKELCLYVPNELYQKAQDDGKLFGIPAERVYLKGVNVANKKDITETADDAGVAESENSSSALPGSTGTKDITETADDAEVTENEKSISSLTGSTGTKDITETADDAEVTENEISSSALPGSTGTYDSASDTNTSSSYFSKTADTIMPQTLFALAALLMLALARLWVSLRKQRA